MAIPLGAENKRQVYILTALVMVIVCVGGYEIYDNFFASALTPARPVPAAAATTRPAVNQPAPVNSRATAANPSASSGPEAIKLTNDDIDPALHLEKLALNEQVEYLGTGRNIFSAQSTPVHSRRTARRASRERGSYSARKAQAAGHRSEVFRLHPGR